jgi:hypothetical protein
MQKKKAVHASSDIETASFLQIALDYRLATYAVKVGHIRDPTDARDKARKAKVRS